MDMSMGMGMGESRAGRRGGGRERRVRKRGWGWEWDGEAMVGDSVVERLSLEGDALVIYVVGMWWDVVFLERRG